MDVKGGTTIMLILNAEGIVKVTIRDAEGDAQQIPL